MDNTPVVIAASTTVDDVLVEIAKIRFKEWVEQTQLFNVIKEETNRSSILPIIRATDGSIEFHLEPGVRIEEMEDLPVEVLVEFFKHSPFYKGTMDNNTITEGIKLLTSKEGDRT